MSETGAVGFRVFQEEDDVDSRAVARIASAGILIGGLGVVFAAWLLIEVAGTLRPNLAGVRGPRPAHAQISSVEQTPIRASRRGIDLRDAQRRELERWRWVDRESGVAAIPIEQAIDIVVQEPR
jgi:hypothetical protein